MLLADQGYPLSNKCLIPYREAMLAGNPARIKLNKCISKTRIIVENVIGRLKRKFRVLDNM